MGEVFGGRYELVDNIGAGGAGTVWRAWDHKEQRYRAAKLLKQSDAASLLRFIRETGHRIEHPHVCAPQSWVGEDDQILFTMDLATGGSVSTMVKDYGPLPDWWALIVTDQLLQALEAIHERGLIHRDIKPANLLLAATGAGLPDVRLADFGIAAHESDPRLTHTTEVVGTPGYMSPLARMGVDPEPAQDLYAAAAVLAEMLTARRPRETDPPVDLSAVAPDVRGFVERLWADSGHGFASASEARAALRTLRATTDPRSHPVEVFDQVGDLPPGWGPGGSAHPRAFGTPNTPATQGLQRQGAFPNTPPTFTGAGFPVTGPHTVGQPAYATGSHAVETTADTRRTPIAVPLLAGMGMICLVAALVLATV
ncbi:serine/threonine-protein kinase [Mariniluteicoccus flavus]